MAYFKLESRQRKLAFVVNKSVNEQANISSEG
jgi:hypothetical protein